MAAPFEPSESRLIYRSAVNATTLVGCSEAEHQLQRSPKLSNGNEPAVEFTDSIEVEADVHAPFDDHTGRHSSS